MLTDAARSELAPSGKLRVGINFGNTVLVQKDESGVPRGIAVDLAEELKHRLGVSLEWVTYDAAGRMADGARQNAWDVAFLATDPGRAIDISFTAPYLEIDSTYLVPIESRFETPNDVDQAGVRIAVSH